VGGRIREKRWEPEREGGGGRGEGVEAGAEDGQGRKRGLSPYTVYT
jgi:hypothetical protein